MKQIAIITIMIIFSNSETVISKKCEKNEVNCENRVTYRVAATYANETLEYTTHDIMSLTTIPINKCKIEDCEFCCLSTNKCGTRKQCENSHYFMTYINAVFYTVVLTLVITFIMKCFQIDSYPEQLNQDKIENLNELINMFGIIKNNRKKLIS
jgi:hypothetical protein